MNGFRVSSGVTPLLPHVVPSTLATVVNNREAVNFSYPFSGVNNNTGGVRNRTWTITLPERVQSSSFPEYVFSITFKGEFTESKINGSTPPITADIDTCASYSMFTNFIYDSTWSPQVLPPPTSDLIISPTTKNFPGAGSTADPSGPPPAASTSFLVWFDSPSRTLKVRAVIQDNYYIAGVFTFQFGDIFPAVSQDFAGYIPSVSVITN